ncbi:MAG: glycosyl transferase family 1 [Hyphomicrobiales bacterium]|nr:glycosyl transferase family 1 [Hyphomicrobiales bacterium]
MKTVFAIPGDLAALTGGYAYDREIMARASDVGMTHLALPQGFPAPTPDDLRETQRLFRTLAPGDLLLIDGLAFGAFTPELLRALPRRTIALVHHPLALETGLAAEDAHRLAASERHALSHAAHVIVTSATTRDLLVADYGVELARITVAVPGVERMPRARGSRAAPQLLAVGSVTPRKGHDVLVAALAEQADLDWRLTIAGSLARAPDHAQAVASQIDAAGLSARIALAGEVSEAERDALYDAADIFVMPSLYEGYGMVLGEAMARGLPIVTTTGGAAAQTVPDAAALKVAPGNPAALAQALARLIGDAPLRARLAEASHSAGQALPSWDDTARIVAGVLARVAEGTGA